LQFECSSCSYLSYICFCNLKEVEVVRQIDPSESVHSKSHNQDNTLENLRITLPTDTISSLECSKVKTFLNGMKHIFFTGLRDLGCSSTVEHEIELDGLIPFKERYRRIPPGMKK
jgi:hypothetical protein